MLTVGTDVNDYCAVANALNLSGIKFDDTRAATNKIKMRMRFKEFDVPSPHFFPCGLSTRKRRILGFPCHCPAIIWGARRNQINNSSEVAPMPSGLPRAHLKRIVIIEQFMEGPELSIDAISNGEITITGVAQDY